MKQCFPNFDEVDEQGHPKQQDAEECWSSIIATMANYHNADIVKKLFEIEFKGTLTNVENQEEPPSELTEVQNKLTCNIANENNPISYLQDGIKNFLLGAVEKHSSLLGRNAQYTKSMKISKLV